MQRMLILVFLTILLFSGCQGMRPNYGLFPGNQQKRTDALWRQGYGFNNPNSERIRNGQQPINFNGKPNNMKTATKDVAGRAVGNLLIFTFAEAIPAVWRGMTKKLRR